MLFADPESAREHCLAGLHDARSGRSVSAMAAPQNHATNAQLRNGVGNWR